MDIKEIDRIMSFVKRYNLSRVYIEDDGFKLEINNECEDSDLISKKVTKEENNELQEIDDEDIYIIKSPLLGTIEILENKETGRKYSIGDRVNEGQALFTIEAMKMFNEVICNQDGIITELLVEDNNFIEYDQPILKIRKVG